MNILVVDDSPLIRELVVGLLTRLGHDAVGAADGAEAAATFATQPFELVLTDLELPDTDGFGVMKAVRERKPDTPVIAVTGHATDEDRERCLAAGMNEHLTKPVSIERLAAALELVTGRPMDWSGAMQALGGDADLLRRVVAAFREEAPLLLKAARKALDARDAEALRRAAHTLHGSMRHLDAPAAQDHARRLEQAALAGDWDAALPLLPALDAECTRILPHVERFLRER